MQQAHYPSYSQVILKLLLNKTCVDPPISEHYKLWKSLFTSIPIIPLYIPSLPRLPTISAIVRSILWRMRRSEDIIKVRL